MKAMKLLFTVALLATALTAVPGAFAAGPFVHFVGAGSSALFNGFEVAAVNDVAPGVAACTGGVGTGAGDTCTVHHWALKNGAGLVDDRGGVATQIGNVWIVWVNSGNSNTGVDTDVWVDVSVDSTVGVRTFLARDPTNGLVATSLNISSDSGVTADNSAAAIASLIYGCNNDGGVCASGTTGDDKTLPSDVFTALNGAGETAGLTDIRPEDAKYATKRANKPLDSSGYFAGLGYGSAGSQLVGTSIQSGTGTSTATAQPVNFSLPGSTDPFNGKAVPTTISVIPVGESPIVVLANRTNTSGLGTIVSGAPYYNNVYDYVPQGSGFVTKLGKLFFGKDCTGDAAAFSAAGVIEQPGAAAAAGQSITINQINDPAADGSLKFIYNLPTAPASLVAGDWITISGSTGGTYDGSYQIFSVQSGGQGPSGTESSFKVSPDPFNTGTINTGENVTGAYWAPSQNFPINVIVREALSGTYNTFEFSSVRIFGSPTGVDGNPGGLSAKSQDANFTDSTASTPAPMPNPTKASACWYPPNDGSTNGTRTRAIGTGEMVKGAGGGGILGTGDGLGYAFFSFSNVSAIATSTKYGYLTLDNVDPIFAQYAPGGTDPGQPAAANGELPACTASLNGSPGGCLPGDVWNGGTSFPNLRNGNYRAWSLLRTICDTAQPACKNTTISISAATFAGGDVTYAYTVTGGSPLAVGQSIVITGMKNAGNDGNFYVATLGPGDFTVVNAAGVTESGSSGKGVYTFGAEGLIAKMQDEIHSGPHGVADFLPFSQDGSFGTGCVAGTPCQGDAGAYRQHYVPQAQYESVDTGSTVSFYNYLDGSLGTDPSNGVSTEPEAGGDVGGCIVAGFPESNSNLGCQQ